MTSLRRLVAALVAAMLLILGIMGPAAADTRDIPDDIRSEKPVSQEATAVEYGLLVGLIAVAIIAT